jgi:hypothetical protein
MSPMRNSLPPPKGWPNLSATHWNRSAIAWFKEAQFTSAIKAQTLGEGLQAHRLEKLNRYETHLDRKFERTLAMLLKLKQLRTG